MINFYDWSEINQSTLFSSQTMSFTSILQNNDYLKEENYSKLKNMISKVNYEYYIEDIQILVSKLKNQYDFINLSSIMYYVSHYKDLLSKLPLKENGIALTYLYQVKEELMQAYPECQMIPFDKSYPKEGIMIYKKHWFIILKMIQWNNHSGGDNLSDKMNIPVEELSFETKEMLREAVTVMKANRGDSSKELLDLNRLEEKLKRLQTEYEEKQEAYNNKKILDKNFSEISQQYDFDITELLLEITTRKRKLESESYMNQRINCFFLLLKFPPKYSFYWNRRRWGNKNFNRWKCLPNFFKYTFKRDKRRFKISTRYYPIEIKV